MKTLLFVATLIAILTACQPQEETPLNTDNVTVSNVKDGILIHMTEDYDNPHRVLMPLKMANMMAMDKDVILYLDIDAVNLVLNDSEDLNYKGFDPLKVQLQSLIDQNVAIYVCPTCLEVAGYIPDDLMAGVMIANKDRFFDFTEGKIVTMNY